MTRIVTFLGLGRKEPPHYEPVRYRYGSVETERTVVHDAATVLAFPGPCEIALLGTAEVHERWVETGLYERCLADALGADARRVTVVPKVVPDGRTEAGRWELFQQLVAELQVPADATVFDITHGYRSQSFFAAAAVAYVRSQRSRERSDVPRPLRILYAAFEARVDDVAPVWDLTQLVDVLSWDAAIDDLLRYGRGDDLERLLIEADRSGRATNPGRRTRLKALGQRVRAFADGLATARIPELLTRLAPELAAEVERAGPDLVDLAPPLLSQVHALKEWCARIAAGSVVSEEGVRAGLALAELYQRLERFAEAAIATRESLVTLYGLRTGVSMGEPGSGAFDAERDRLEKAIPKDDYTSAFGQAWSRVRELRNDIQHGGFCSHPRPVSRIREQLREAVEAARAACRTVR